MRRSDKASHFLPNHQIVALEALESQDTTSEGLSLLPSLVRTWLGHQHNVGGLVQEPTTSSIAPHTVESLHGKSTMPNCNPLVEVGVLSRVAFSISL